MTQHPYPSSFPPGAFWATDVAWDILDVLPVGTLDLTQRAYLAGLISGVVCKYANEGPPRTKARTNQ